MPKVALTKEQKVEEKLREITKQTDIALYSAGIQRKSLAEAAGVEPSAITQQFKRGRITMPVYVAAQMLLENK